MTAFLRRLFWAGTLALGAGPAFRANVYVEPVTTLGQVASGDAQAVGQQVQSSLQANGQTVVTDAGAADYALRTKVSRQGDWYTATIGMEAAFRIFWLATSLDTGTDPVGYGLRVGVEF